MDKLATLYRAAQFFAHRAHNLCSGPTFFSDHGFLGDMYGTYEDAYDTLIERLLGEGKNPNLVEITKDAAAAFAARASSKDTQSMLQTLLKMEKEFCAEVGVLMKGELPDGDQNLLQGLADESLGRQYKLGQRLKNVS